MCDFLQKLLPHSGWYFIDAKMKMGGAQRHHSYQDIQQMGQKAEQLNASGQDVYLACVTYSQMGCSEVGGKQRQRTAENAAYAKSFWLDIDCGHDKATSGRGYSTPLVVAIALVAFCKEHDPGEFRFPGALDKVIVHHQVSASDICQLFDQTITWACAFQVEAQV